MRPMQDLQKPVHYKMPFVAFPRDTGERVLSIFSLPGGGEEERLRSMSVSALLKEAYRHTPMKQADEGPAAAALHPMLRQGEVLDFVEKVLDATRLTAAEAEAVVAQLRAHTDLIDAAWATLTRRLRRTVEEVVGSWRSGAHAEWNHDLRFYGEWWLTLRSVDTVESQRARDLFGIAEGERCTSLLPSGGWGVEAENTLISDLARRLHGPLYHLTLLHLDCFDINPGRMQVFLFDGVLPLKKNLCEAAQKAEKERCKEEVGSFSRRSRREARDPEELLGTLSFSNCNIETASLMVLLLALAEDGETARTTALDLSCNRLTSSSLECFTTLLGRTKVKKLDLRYNNLHASRGAEFLSFLTEGCLNLTELSLCSTGLSHAQIRVLLYALPRMPNLRVLLLNFLNIPLEMAMEVHSAVRKSRLQYISIVGCEVNGHPTLMQELVACCAKNRQAEGVGMDSSPNASFFEELFRKMEAKGCAPLFEKPSLVADFEPYTNNDPSLFPSNQSIN